MSDYKPHVVFVVTSDKLGWYLPELAHPHSILAPHCRVTTASHSGGEAPIDQFSITASKDDAICTEFLQTKLWESTVKVADLLPEADGIDCIFYVGGYGPMKDLVDSKPAADIVVKLYADKKIVSGICHGPAVFSRIKDPEDQSKYLLDGHRVTGISNAECDTLTPVNGLKDPWSVEDALNKATGGRYEKADAQFSEKIVVSKKPDGRMILTGQQPASGMALGKAVYQELFKKPYSA